VRPHPRLWGTFPRVLGHYVREIGLLTLEDALRRMTGLPAANYRLAGRAVIREGAFADLVLFDAAKIIDTASFDDPVQPAKGIEMVLVMVAPCWIAGKWSTTMPGGS
jgi:N-acyl-D-amino-acid deacylase